MMSPRSSRLAIRCFWAVMMIAGMHHQCLGDDSSKGKFVAGGQVLNVSKTVPNVSDDGLVVTHILESVSVAVGGRRTCRGGAVIR